MTTYEGDIQMENILDGLCEREITTKNICECYKQMRKENPNWNERCHHSTIEFCHHCPAAHLNEEEKKMLGCL